MQINCPNCNKKFKIEDSKLHKKIVAKCKECKNIFYINSDGSTNIKNKFKIIQCNSCLTKFKIQKNKIVSKTYNFKCKNCGQKIVFDNSKKSLNESNNNVKIHEINNKAKKSQVDLTFKRKISDKGYNDRSKYLISFGFIITCLLILLTYLFYDHLQKQDNKLLEHKTKPKILYPQKPHLTDDNIKIAEKDQLKKNDLQETNITYEGIKPFACINFNMKLLWPVIENLIPDDQKNIQFSISKWILKISGPDHIKIFIFYDEKNIISPLIQIANVSSSNVNKILNTEDIKPHILNVNNNCFKFINDKKYDKTDTFIWVFENNTFISKDFFVDNINQIEKNINNFKVLNVDEILKDNIVFVSVFMNKFFDKNWNKKLKENDVLKTIPQVISFIDTLKTIIDNIEDSFNKMESFSIGYNFLDSDKRVIHYISHFNDNEYGQQVLNNIKQGKSEQSDFFNNIFGFLKDERLSCSSNFENNSLKLDIKWHKENDETLINDLIGLAFNYMFSKSFEIKEKPSKDPIIPQYTKMPLIEQNVDFEKIKQEFPNLLKKSIFRGSYWEMDDYSNMNLICDPVIIANADLSSLSYTVVDILSENGESLFNKISDQKFNKIDFNNTDSTTISLKINKGYNKNSLNKAILRFNLVIPTEINLRVLTKDDINLKTNNHNIVLKRLEKDISVISYKKCNDIAIYAFDNKGNALLKQESMSSSSTIFSRFKGIIETLKVICANEKESFSFDLEIDLNKGMPHEIGHMPDENVPYRYDYYEFLPYYEVKNEEITALNVDWIENINDSWVDQLKISFSNGPLHGKANWNLNFFGLNTVVSINGNPVKHNSAFSFDMNKGELSKANAVFGNVDLMLSSKIERLIFEKTNDNLNISKELSNNKTITLRFNKNEVAIKSGNIDIIQFMACDKNGKRFKKDFYSRYQDGYEINYFWGIPEKFIIDVSLENINHKIPVNIVKRDIDNKAYENFINKIKLYCDIGLILKELSLMIHKTNFAENISSLYYIYNNNNREIRLIDKELAHSDINGKNRYNYELKPYKGYYFTLLKGIETANEEKDYERYNFNKTFKWQKGSFQIKPFKNLPDPVAIPFNKADPYIIYSFYDKQSFMKILDHDESNLFLPENFVNSGWIKPGCFK